MMWSKSGFGRLLAVLALGAAGAVQATPTVYDFENLSGGVLTTQLAGLTFTNTSVLIVGTSVNEDQFPAQSGQQIAADEGGPITIDFAAPMSSVGAFFTYFVPLTLTFYDASNNVLGSVASAFGANDGLAGDFGSSPNEFLGLARSGIRRLTIEGATGGLSFTMDDLTVDAGTLDLPLPSTGVLAALGVAGLAARRRRRD